MAFYEVNSKWTEGDTAAFYVYADRYTAAILAGELDDVRREEVTSWDDRENEDGEDWYGI